MVSMYIIVIGLVFLISLLISYLTCHVISLEMLKQSLLLTVCMGLYFYISYGIGIDLQNNRPIQIIDVNLVQHANKDN